MRRLLTGLVMKFKINWLSKSKPKAVLNPWMVTALFILGLAIFSRLYLLGQVPVGMTWDEVALGYVGKMLILTGRDEHSALLPTTFTSFGDFKSPLAFYFTGISTALFGLKTLAVRLPFALAGVGSVIAIGYLTWQIVREKWYALLASFILTLLPWHLYFSRVSFEAGVALFGYLLLMVGWLGWLNTNQNKKISALWPLLMIGGTFINAYTYHAGKLVMPLTWLLIGLYTWWFHNNWWQKQLRAIAATVIATFVLVLPLLADMLLGPGVARAGQTSFLGQLPWWQSTKMIIINLGRHLSLDFLVHGETTTLRHSGGQYGVLLYTQLALFWLGVTFALGRLWQQLYHQTQQKWWTKIKRIMSFRSSYRPKLVASWFWLVLLIVNFLPATIGYEVPHSNRALLAVVPIVILSVLGVRELSEEISFSTFAALVGSLILIMMLEWSSWWSYYFSTYASLSSAEWLDGYQQAVTKAQTYVQDHKKVKFTNAYGQPDIFYAFYNQVPVEIYQSQRLPAIDFGAVTVDDLNHYDVIFTTPDNPLPLSKNQIITREDGSVAFQVYENL